MSAPTFTLRRGGFGLRAAWWTPHGWTHLRELAERINRDEAESMAEDWQSWSDSKGAGYVFSADGEETDQ